MNEMSQIHVGVVEDHPVTLRGLAGELIAAGLTRLVVAESTEALTEFPQVVLCDLHLPPGCRQGAEAVRFLVGEGCMVIAFSALATAESQLAALAAGAVGFVPKTAAGNLFRTAVETVARGGHWIRPDLAGWLLEEVRATSSARGQRDQRVEMLLQALAQGDDVQEFERWNRLPAGTARTLMGRVLVEHRARWSCAVAPSPREAEVIDAVARRRMHYRQAAEALGMAESTLKTHLKAIKDKYLRAHPEASPDLTPKSIAILWAKELDLP